RDDHGARIEAAEVHPGGFGVGDDLIGARLLESHGHRVEERVVDQFDAELAQPGREECREPMHVLRDGLDPTRPVIDGVHRGDDGEQRLRGADVARRLLAADVLLAGLQRHPERALSLRVHRDADDASGHVPHVLLAAGEVGGVRSAIAERHTEALRRSDRDVAPSSPGGASRHKERMSAATTASAPCAWTLEMKGRRSRTFPSVDGYWRSAPKILVLKSNWSGSPTTTCQPRGFARVRTTSMVCGWQSEAMKNAEAPLPATA